MRSRSEFFREYRITGRTFAKSKLRWDDLVKIHDDYVKIRK